MELNLHRKKVFVCHVKTGYQDREQHITQMYGGYFKMAKII